MPDRDGLKARAVRMARHARVLTQEALDGARAISGDWEDAPALGPALHRLRGAAKRLRPDVAPATRPLFYLQHLYGRRLEEKIACVEALATAEPPDPSARMSLARFFAQIPTAEAAERGLRWLGEDATRRDAAVLRAECLIRLDRPEEARAALEAHLARGGAPVTDVCIAMAKALDAAGRARGGAGPDAATLLDWLNRGFAPGGIAPLALRDPDAALSIDNLAAPAAAPVLDESAPMISVVMPIFNAERHLATSLRGLREQSWRNLEIILVDDRSTDGSARLAEEAAAADPRVRVLRNEANVGCYVSRNAGLAAARGPLVTFHDADDWSHPQKIERQARDLLDNPTRIANFPLWARMDGALRGQLRAIGDAYVGAHYMSMMLRREAALATAGFFDAVRAGADMEYFGRLSVLRPRRIRELGGAPSSIGRVHDSNLTTSGPFGFERFGDSHVRTEYRDANERHRMDHRRRDPAALRYPHPMPTRPYPAPARLQAGTPHGAPPAPRRFDVLAAGRLKPPHAAAPVAAEIAAQAAAGLRLGVLHLRDADPAGYLDPRRDLAPDLRALVQSGAVERMLGDESAVCRLLALRHPAALQRPLEEFARIEAEQVVVIVDEPPRAVSGAPLYNPAACVATVRDAFGDSVQWRAATPTLERAFREAGGDVAFGALWTPAAPPVAAAPRRSAPGRRLALGRRLAEDALAWPADPAALLAAYPEDGPAQTLMLGEAAAAHAVLGRPAAGWRIIHPRRLSAARFLAMLDAYVHFDDAGGATGLTALLEAMAAGVVAVADPALEPVLGDAAVYAAPADAVATLRRLADDADAFAAQRARGAEAARTRFAPERHRERVAAAVTRAAAE